MNACRHYLGLYPDNRPSCVKGRDVRAWARRCNGGTDRGIALRLPCTKQHSDSEKPLFDCPELDRKTQEEVDAARAALTEKMDRIVAAIPKISAMKTKMIANKLKQAEATCPWCGEKDALRLWCAIGVNNHLRCHCTACNEGFME